MSDKTTFRTSGHELVELVMNKFTPRPKLYKLFLNGTDSTLLQFNYQKGLCFANCGKKTPKQLSGPK